MSELRGTNEDVKDSKETEQRFRAIFDGAFGFIGLLKPDGTLIEANQTALNYIGARASEVIGRPFWETAWWKGSAEQQERLKAAMAEAATGKFVRFEAQHTGQDGAVDTVDFSLQPAIDDTGRLTYIIAEGRRITARKQAEKDSAIFAAIVGSANDAIISLTLDGVIQTWNEGAERLFGWSAAQAIGQHVKMLVPPTRVSEMSGVFGRLSRGEPLPHLDTVRQRKDGSLVNVSSAISPVKQGEQIVGASVIIRDITERKLAQAALSASEARWRALLAAIPGMVFTADADGQNDFVNDYFYTYTGLSPDAGLGVGWAQAVHPDDRERAHARWMDSVQTGVPYENEIRIRRHDGVYRWFRARGVALRDDHGEIVKWAGGTLDIEEIKQTQLALQASEERLEIALAVGGMGAWDRDLRTGKSTWDNRMFEMCGFEPSAAVDVPAVYAQVHPDDLPGMKRAIDQTLQTGAEYRYEYRFLRPDGRTVWMHARGGLRRDANGTPTHIIGVNFDITDQKQAEQALRESEERFRLLAQNIDQIFWFEELEPQRVIYVSPAFEQIWGLPPDLLYENSHLWIEMVHPEDRSNVQQAFDEWVAGRAKTYNIDFRIVRQDGEVRWINNRAIVIGSKDGLPYKLSGIATDITKRKWAEEKLREADRRKDEFLAMLGHELRNPLGIINTSVHLLHQNGLADRTLMDLRDIVHRQVDQMARLLDDLLDVSRIARGQVRLHKEPCNFTALMRETLDEHRALFNENGLRLVEELPEQSFWIMGDSMRLKQIIGNALQNAIKFTDRAGTVTVSLSKAETESTVILTVRDTGIGMDMKMLQRAFEPFSQSETGRERSRGGLGLGLALVKGLVEMHDGSATIWSEGPGRGSELVIRLPLMESPIHRREATVEVTNGPAPTCRILLIEDNPMGARTMRIFLTQSGHEVEIAQSGPDGIEAARRFQPQIVLCDLGLPGMDGYAVARALRHEPGLETTYLIALTGYGQEEDRRRSLEAGFDAHITKPVDPTKLMSLLASISVKIQQSTQTPN